MRSQTAIDGTVTHSSDFVSIGKRTRLNSSHFWLFARQELSIVLISANRFKRVLTQSVIIAACAMMTLRERLILQRERQRMTHARSDARVISRTSPIWVDGRTFIFRRTHVKLATLFFVLYFSRFFFTDRMLANTSGGHGKPTVPSRIAITAWFYRLLRVQRKFERVLFLSAEIPRLTFPCGIWCLRIMCAR